MTGSSDILNEFIAETLELLDRISLSLESGSGTFDKEILGSIYRDLHTIKGSAHLYGCRQIGNLAHTMEACMDPVRHGTLELSGELIDRLYSGIDVIRGLVDGIRAEGKEPDMSRELGALVPGIVELTVKLLGDSFPVPASVMVTNEKITKEAIVKMSSVKEGVKAPMEKVAPPNREVVAETSAPAAQEPKLAVVSQTPSEGGESSSSSPSPAQGGADQRGLETIRVQVQLLDNLMNLAGELVLIRNQVVLHDTQGGGDGEFQKISQRLNILTSELQNEVMKTRMQPIGNVLNRFHRVVRDMSRDLGKKIDLRLEGVETELDKTLIEAVKDPLTHIVRNAIDHGLELPDQRTSNGKQATGTLVIRAFHEGGQVIVEIADDGRGISREKVANKAIEKNLITPEQAEQMPDKGIHNLIFAPGFSTAEKVSDISGRGVGMDVVRTNIEKIGGMVDLSTVEGKGTTMRLKIPLTLAIVPALIVDAGDERFAIPQIKLVELVRVDRKEFEEGKIENLQGQPVYRLRGNLLPLISLSHTLAGEETTFEGTKEYLEARWNHAQATSESVNITVLNADGRYFGLIVDEILDSTDIVVKPISGFLKSIGIYSGATVMGDGSVALTLDVIGLATHVNISGMVDERDAFNRTTESDENVNMDSAEYLMVDVGAPGRYAVPLCLVNRLEEFKTSQVEMSGEQPVVRYRGAILPILNVPQFLKLPFKKDRVPPETFSVFVMEKAGHLYGLQVDAIQDVLTVEGSVDTSLRDRAGIMGSIVYDGSVVVVLDAFQIIEACVPNLHRESDENVDQSKLERIMSNRSGRHILLAEDNAFFRNHVKKVLNEAGFGVTTAPDGEAALQILSESKEGQFDLVLSDIEMPRMDGYQLAAKVREQGRFKSLPMIALTTKFRKQDMEKGFASGFNAYLEKLKEDKLVNELDAQLGVVKHAS